MGNKRGQIALFVIIAIAIVAAIVLVYMFRSSIFSPALSAEESQKIVSSQVQPVRDYITECMKISSRRTLNTMGRQGGYVLPKLERVSIPSNVMPDAPPISYALFYDSSRGYVNQLPSINEMKTEFAYWLENSVEFENCINKFAPFTKILDVQSSYNLTVDRKNLDFGETSGEIVIPFTYPVKLSKGNSTTLVDNYVVKIPINLQRIRETSARITNSIAIGKNYMEVIRDESEVVWAELRDNPDADKLFIGAEAFNNAPAGSGGNTNNDKNLLFTLRYERTGLDAPFEYSLLIGIPA